MVGLSLQSRKKQRSLVFDNFLRKCVCRHTRIHPGRVGQKMANKQTVRAGKECLINLGVFPSTKSPFIGSVNTFLLGVMKCLMLFSSLYIFVDDLFEKKWRVLRWMKMSARNRSRTCECVCVSTLVQQILHATFFSTLPSFLATKSLRARFVPSLLAWFGFLRRGFESQYHSVDCKALLHQTFFC